MGLIVIISIQMKIKIIKVLLKMTFPGTYMISLHAASEPSTTSVARTSAQKRTLNSPTMFRLNLTKSLGSQHLKRVD